MAATERTIAYLRRSDRLLPGDDATLALVRTTAATLDAAEGDAASVAARVHLAAIEHLFSGHAAPATDDDLAAIRALIRGA